MRTTVLLVLTLAGASVCRAEVETFSLKDGKKITGTVLKRTDSTIWVSTEKGDVGIGRNQLVGAPDIVDPPRPMKAPSPPVPEPVSEPPPPAKAAQPRASRPNFSWYEGAWGYERAMQEQKRSGRPFLVYFHATWCPACKQVNSEFHPLREVAEELNHVLKVKVDIDTDKDLTAQYGVTQYPTFYAVHPSGAQQLNSRDWNQLFAQYRELANWTPAT
jgi:thiol-disulfide isomerase/thioredoxin